MTNGLSSTGDVTDGFRHFDGFTTVDGGVVCTSDTDSIGEEIWLSRSVSMELDDLSYRDRLTDIASLRKLNSYITEIGGFGAWGMKTGLYTIKNTIKR